MQCKGHIGIWCLVLRALCAQCRRRLTVQIQRATPVAFIREIRL